VLHPGVPGSIRAAISSAISGLEQVRGNLKAVNVPHIKYRDSCKSDLAVDICIGILGVEFHYGLPRSPCLSVASRLRFGCRVPGGA
jgi:hypothetical protein